MAKKKKKAAPLSEAQLEIMHLVWQRDEVRVSDVWAQLAQRRKVSRNTVQTLMSRLESKGWLQHREDGQTFYYSACRPRNATQHDLARRLIDTVFGGSVEGFVMTLLEGGGVSKEEAERIRQLIEQATRRDS